jgi:hypothetical protein
VVDGELVFAESQLEIAALRDVQRGFNRTGGIGECGEHFVRTFDEQLVGIELPTRFVVEPLACLYAEQDFVGYVILVVQIVTVVGSDQGDTDFGRDLAKKTIDLGLLGHVVVLDFQVVAVTEDSGVFLNDLSSDIVTVRHHCGGKFSAETAAKADYALVEFAEQLFVDSRLVVKPVDVTLRDHLA